MVRFLFWNLNGHKVAATVVDMAWQEYADVLILAECGLGKGTPLWA